MLATPWRDCYAESGFIEWIAKGAAAPNGRVEEVGKKRRSGKKEDGNGANLGFKTKLWLAADKLRSKMDAAECKHVVLGLIFLKYISDAFEDKMQRLTSELAEQFRESARLESAIKANLKELGYGL